MDLGTGVALGGLCVSAGAVCITAIRSSTKKPMNGNGLHANGLLAHPLCSEHSGVAECLKAIKETGNRHEEWLGEISKDVKALVARK